MARPLMTSHIIKTTSPEKPGKFCWLIRFVMNAPFYMKNILWHIVVRRWNKFIILYWFVLLKLKWKVIYYFEQKSTDFDIKNSSKITILAFRPIGWVAIFMIYKLFQKCKRCVFALYIFISWIPKFFLKLWLAKSLRLLRLEHASIYRR